MSRNSDFKVTQVFDWASEPVDERPSEFGRSTGYSQLSGYGSLQETRGSASRRQRSHSSGMARLAMTASVVLGLSLTAVFTLVHYLRAGVF